MEALNEGKSRLTGEKLTKRMEELGGLISAEHIEAQAAYRGTLEHARNAGEWLIEAKWRKGHRRKWGEWKRQFSQDSNIAERTMSQYMRIARHWEAPEIVEARGRGFEIESISTFLRVMRGGTPAMRTNPEGYTDAAVRRRTVRERFAKYLRTLDKFEAEVLEWTIDEVLEAFNKDLRMRVCGSYGGPYYEHREEATNPDYTPVKDSGPYVCHRARRVRKARGRGLWDGEPGRTKPTPPTRPPHYPARPTRPTGCSK